MSHLTHYQDVVEFAELIAEKKLDERQKNPIEGFLKSTWGDGYQRAANIAREVIYIDKFQLSPENFDWFIQVHRKHMQAWGDRESKEICFTQCKRCRL